MYEEALIYMHYLINKRSKSKCKATKIWCGVRWSASAVYSLEPRPFTGEMVRDGRRRS